MSRWWLVELEPDLSEHYTTRNGVWAGIRSVNGVKRVTDLDAISKQTLDEWVGELFVEPIKRTRRPKRNGMD